MGKDRIAAFRSVTGHKADQIELDLIQVILLLQHCSKLIEERFDD